MFGLGSRMAKFMRAEKNSGFKLTEHGILEIEPDGPFTFRCEYNVHHFSKKNKSFFREQYKKPCSMPIVGMIKAKSL